MIYYQIQKFKIMTHQLLLLVFFFFSSVNTEAQPPKKDIESCIEALNKATISQDNPMLEKLTAEELSYGHSTGLVENKAAYIKDILSGPTKFFQIDNTNQTIDLAGDMAIVRNICSIKGTKDGAPLDIKIGVLMVWKKEGAEWKLLARQGYKLQ
jgi:ketosteroid isomerase-like protein